MANEQELQLSVKFVDQASPELAKLKQAMQQTGQAITDQQKKNSAEQAKNQKELEEHTKKIHEGFSKAISAFGNYSSKISGLPLGEFGKLALEATHGVEGLGVAVAAMPRLFAEASEGFKDIANDMLGLEARSKSVGIASDQFRALGESMRTMTGVDLKVGEQKIQSFFRSIQRAATGGTEETSRLGTVFTNPEQVRAMLERWQTMRVADPKGSPAAIMNEALAFMRRQEAENIRRNPRTAEDITEKQFAALSLPPELRIARGEFVQANQKQIEEIHDGIEAAHDETKSAGEHAKATDAATLALNNMVSGPFNDLRDAITAFTDKFPILSSTLDAAGHALFNLAETLGGIGGTFWAAGRIKRTFGWFRSRAGARAAAGAVEAAAPEAVAAEAAAPAAVAGAVAPAAAALAPPATAGLGIGGGIGAGLTIMEAGKKFEEVKGPGYLRLQRTLEKAVPGVNWPEVTQPGISVAPPAPAAVTAPPHLNIPGAQGQGSGWRGRRSEIEEPVQLASLGMPEGIRIPQAPERAPGLAESFFRQRAATQEQTDKTEAQTKATTDNTDQLMRLNDILDPRSKAAAAGGKGGGAAPEGLVGGPAPAATGSAPAAHDAAQVGVRAPDIAIPAGTLGPGDTKVIGGGGGALGELRQRQAQELADPAVRARLLAYTHAEVGSQGPRAQQAFMESILNRAAARGQSIRQTLSGGYFPAITHSRAAGGLSEKQTRQLDPILGDVLGGSNISNFATGNASGSVGFGGGPRTFSAGGENFGIEAPDARWARRMASGAGPASRTASASTGADRMGLPGASGVAGDPTVPSGILARARAVAFAGGPGAVEKFMASQGYPKHAQWCGDFASSVVKASGYKPPPGSSVASNWRRWGEVDPTPHAGDIAVRKTSYRAGHEYVPTGETGSHVTLVEGVDPKTGMFTGLGGNQGAFEKQFASGQYEFRRPPGGGGGIDVAGASALTAGADGGAGGGGGSGGGGGFPGPSGGLGGALGGLGMPAGINIGGLLGRRFGPFGGLLGGLLGGGGGGFGGILGGLIGGGGGMLGGGLGGLLGGLGGSFLDRSVLDAGSMTHRVEGTGKLSVDVNAPPGTNVHAAGGGLFKRVEMSRQTMMTPTVTGPHTLGGLFGI